MTDVIVIGGGFAGLSTATALAEHGLRVTVLEARPGLGGRATAFTDPVTGERVDNGQHILIGGYRETFRFLGRIGSADAVRLQGRLAVDVIDRDGGRSRLVCPSLPSPLHLLAGLATWPALTWSDRAAALRIGPAIKRGATQVSGTVRQWLLQQRQTRRLIDLLWEPLAVAALNEPIDVAAAGPFVAVLARMFGGRSRDASLGLPLKPLDELYAEPARRFIDAHGGSVHTGAPAHVVHDAATYVTLRTGPLRARAVVCAVPWFALPEVLGGCAALRPVIDAAGATPASAIVTVNLWLDRAVMTGEFLGLPGRTLQWVFDKKQLFGDGSSHLSLVSSGADAIVGRSNADLVELAVGELREAIPEACTATVRRAVVVREKRATFSVAPGLPPRPGTRTPLPDLFLAGDWIDTGLPATIESAVVSGHAAAAAVLDYLSQSVNPQLRHASLS